MNRLLSIASMLVPLAALASPDAGTVAPKVPFPPEEQCLALGAPLKPLPFAPGETLEFDIDALGAKAGTMTMRTLPARPDGRWNIEALVETNTFFSKVRQVKGTGTSTVDPKTMRPSHYLEDATENEWHRVADVAFGKNHSAHLVSTVNGKTGSADLHFGNDVSDVVSAIFLLRSIPLKEDQPMCFDVYGIRRIWRVWGKVLPREHVSLPVGEFDAWHLAGQAARLDIPDARREVHVWVTDDARRLPLAALGTIDLGAVRATLKSFSRPNEKAKRAENKGNLKW